MKYSIKKSDVIKAIATEPLLTYGRFFGTTQEPDETSEVDTDNGKCRVCAVGAVLRATSRCTFSKYDAWDVTRDMVSWDDYYKAHESGNFLSILSVEYEIAARFGDDLDLARFHAIMVAEAMCPDTLTFEV